MATNIFIVDEHPMVVAGVTAMLHSRTNFRVAGSVSHPADAIPFLQKNKVDVVLLDINLVEMHSLELCKQIKQEFEQIKIIGVSAFGGQGHISGIIKNGASGYLLKSSSPEEIIEAIQTVLDGRIYLSSPTYHVGKKQSAKTEHPVITRREREILELIADGFTTSQIADKLFISHLTVESHRKNLLTKLKVNNTASLIRLAVTHHLI